jgi:hypothetical protein
MKILSILLVSALSLTASAGYECGLKLAHTEDLYKTIAEKTVTIGETMRSGSEGTLYTELQKGKTTVTLEIRSVIDGWAGTEDATFVVMRKISKKKKSQQLPISEKITLKGDQTDRLWFDTYKLDINCRITPQAVAE